MQKASSNQLSDRSYASSAAQPWHPRPQRGALPGVKNLRGTLGDPKSPLQSVYGTAVILCARRFHLGGQPAYQYVTLNVYENQELSRQPLNQEFPGPVFLNFTDEQRALVNRTDQVREIVRSDVWKRLEYVRPNE